MLNIFLNKGSAKDGENIREIFQKLGETILQNDTTKEKKNISESIKMKKISDAEKKKCCN
jgi:hypothetical protein